MCLAAIYWARIPKVFYGNTRRDAARIAFDDEFFYRELKLPAGKRRVRLRPLLRKEALSAFEEWLRRPDRIPY